MRKKEDVLPQEIIPKAIYNELVIFLIDQAKDRYPNHLFWATPNKTRIGVLKEGDLPKETIYVSLKDMGMDNKNLEEKKTELLNQSQEIFEFDEEDLNSPSPKRT